MICNGDSWHFLFGSSFYSNSQTRYFPDPSYLPSSAKQWFFGDIAFTADGDLLLSLSWTALARVGPPALPAFEASFLLKVSLKDTLAWEDETLELGCPGANLLVDDSCKNSLSIVFDSPWITDIDVSIPLDSFVNYAFDISQVSILGDYNKDSLLLFTGGSVRTVPNLFAISLEDVGSLSAGLSSDKYSVQPFGERWTKFVNADADYFVTQDITSSLSCSINAFQMTPNNVMSGTPRTEPDEI